MCIGSVGASGQDERNRGFARRKSSAALLDRAARCKRFDVDDAYAEASDDGVLKLTACMGTVDGRRMILESQAGMIVGPLCIAVSLEMTLVSQGGREILAQLAPKRASGRKSARRRPAKKRAKARSQVGRFMGMGHYDSFGSSYNNTHRYCIAYDCFHAMTAPFVGRPLSMRSVFIFRFS